MKTSKKTGKTAAAAKPKKGEDIKNRKMEPVKSKELKNQRFDVDDEDDLDNEIMDENFKGFDDFFEAEEDDDE